MARKAVLAFKDSYVLDFINTEEIGERDKEDIDERVVEKEIVHNIKKFIMEFGKDFAFVATNIISKSTRKNFSLTCCSLTANSMRWL